MRSADICRDARDHLSMSGETGYLDDESRWLQLAEAWLERILLDIQIAQERLEAKSTAISGRTQNPAQEGWG